MGLFTWLRRRYKSFDRRRAPRIDVDVPTDFAQDEDEVFLFHQTLNVSRTGAYIRTDEPFDAGHAIEIIFTLLEGGDFDAPAEKIACVAEVVYAVETDGTEHGGRPKGMGVRFKDLADEEWERIETWIRAADGGKAARVGVALADRRKLEEIRRFQPELKSAVESFSWDSPAAGEGKSVEEEAIPDDELIAEIEERMRSERPGLKAVREGDPPPRRPEAGLEVRRDGTIEAKRAQADTGLVATVPDEDDGTEPGEGSG